MKTMLRLALAAAVIGFAAPAFAQTITSNFQVTATVQRSCQIVVANTLAFGVYDALSVANHDAATTYQVRCNRNTAYRVGIDRGAHDTLAAAPNNTERSMQGVTVNTEFLAYQLFRDAARTLPWGTNYGVDTANFVAANSAAATHDIYGRIPPGQDVPAQDYVDSPVILSVNY